MSWSWEAFYATVTAACVVSALIAGGPRRAAVLCMGAAWVLEGAVYYTRPAFAGNFLSLMTDATLIFLLACHTRVRRTTWGKVVLAVLMTQLCIHIAYRESAWPEYLYHPVVNVLYVLRIVVAAVALQWLLPVPRCRARRR